MIIIII
ncbi:RNA polymerase sigma factor, partial [Acinetobacter baumannii]